MDPTAQGQHAGADGSQSQGQPAQPNQAQPAGQTPEGGENAGFQARINELTAARREAERQAQLAAEQNRQLLEVVELMRMNAQQAQQPAEPPVEIDPEEQRRLQMVLKPFQQQMQMMQTQMASFAVQQQAAAMGISDPTVVARAQKTIQQYAMQGQQVDPTIALQLAYGQAQLEAQRAALASGMQRQHMNAGMQSMFPAGGAPPPPPAPAAPQGKPAGYDSWDMEAQMAYLEQQVGNKPL